jgi:hypothetical protein
VVSATTGKCSLYVFAWCFVVCTTTVHAQPKDWVVAVLSGRTYADVRCEKLRDDLLFLRRSKALRDTLAIDSVVAVSRESRGDAVLGVAMGALGGGVLGSYIGSKIASTGGEWDPASVGRALNGFLIGALIGGIAGGAIAANLDEAKYFDLSNLTREKKKVLLEKEVINK